VGNEPWLRFALLFGFLAITSEVLYFAFVLDSAWFDAYLDLLAEISGGVLRLFGTDVSVHGSRIASEGFAVEVAQGCDAIEVCSLLASAVVAFPLGIAARLRGLGMGVLVLQILNLVRIVTLYWIGANFPDYFQDSHEIAWPAFLIVATIAIWILWVRFESPQEAPARHAA
jgi:exosortase H (IPTLxxWG-CTERM-specific)